MERLPGRVPSAVERRRDARRRLPRAAVQRPGPGGGHKPMRTFELISFCIDLFQTTSSWRCGSSQRRGVAQYSGQALQVGAAFAGPLTETVFCSEELLRREPNAAPWQAWQPEVVVTNAHNAWGHFPLAAAPASIIAAQNVQQSFVWELMPGALGFCGGCMMTVHAGRHFFFCRQPAAARLAGAGLHMQDTE